VVAAMNRQPRQRRTRSPHIFVGAVSGSLPDRQDVLGQRAHLVEALQGQRMVGEESQPGPGAAQLADGAQQGAIPGNPQAAARQS